MKKSIICIWLCVMLLVCAFNAIGEETGSETVIQVREKTGIPAVNTENNPVIEGESPLTGLPASGEAYTPIMLPLDLSPEGFPLWGIGDASLIFQVPLSVSGMTRLFVLFGDQYPEQAGGVRSGRMTMLPLARTFHAVFAYAGVPPIREGDTSVDYWMSQWSFRKPTRHYNLLGARFRERIHTIDEPHNLSAHVRELHEHLAQRKMDFEVRPFLFTDQPLDRGAEATEISLRFLSRNNPDVDNAQSACTFRWTEETGYIRSSSFGDMTDRTTGEIVPFANVIIMRVPVLWKDDYAYYESHMRGSGQADIFQSGRYIEGTWVHASRTGRLIFLDENGKELELQRGKSFIVLGNENVVASYR